jgi:two-component system, OmpR family, response regulator CpxR
MRTKNSGFMGEQYMQIKVLLVDDEKDFVETLAQRLEVRDFDVKTALNGDEALGLIREFNVDVIVLDVLMPGKDGIQTLKEIKEVKPLVTVIMLTGNATVDTAIQGMRLGAYDYLMKPTETEILVEKIKSAHKIKAEHEDRIRQAEIEGLLKRRGW